MKHYSLLILFFLSTSLLSQNRIRGKITNKVTHEPLAFVNIILNTGEVFTSNIDGTFSIRPKGEVTSMECKYVGYKSKVVPITSSYIQIELEPKDILLKEFKVIPGENPANRIIRRVIQNRKLNNPEKLSSFQYLSYNKTNYGLDSIVNIGDSTIADSTMLFGGVYLLFIESVARHKYIRPNLKEEIIIANKVSGFKSPSFSSIVTQFQPFGFYKNTLKILDKNYLNPISKGSLSKYDFRIEDTILNATDTTFILSFKPKKGKNFDGLTGLLYINTNMYAIQNVIAEPFEKAFISMKIQQKYSFVNQKQWFPEQLNYQLIIENYPEEGLGTTLNGEAFIDSVVLEPNLSKRDISLVNLKIENGANDKDSTYWDGVRKTPLTKREKKTYRIIDSIGEAYEFDNKLGVIEKIVAGKIPVKFVDINLAKSLMSNNYEGFRLGLGLSTNDKISKYFSVGGFFGYGLKDKEWKYGGDLTVFLNKAHEVELKGEYKNTIEETSQTDLNQFGTTNFQANTYIGFQKDRIRSQSVSLSFRALRYAKFNLSVTNLQFSPRYAYLYKGESLQSTFKTNSEVGIFLKYAYKERLVENFNQRLSLGTTYPVLSIAYSRGFKGFRGSEFDYNRVEARIEASHFFKNLGQSSVRLQGGMVDKPLPYNMQFSGFGSRVGDYSVYIRNSFQTVSPYEFVMDQYAVFHYAHNFGSLLLKTKKFKPQFTVHQHIGIGTLSNAKEHSSIDIQTMEKGFIESGLQIDNIVRINYFNVAYLGLGGGINYRYGAYHLPELKDNFAYTISFIFTTN